MEKNVGIAMIAAANKALKFKNANLRAEVGDVISHVINTMHFEKEAKIGAIASATTVFHYKEKYPNANDREVIRFIVNRMPEIMRDMQGDNPEAL